MRLAMSATFHRRSVISADIAGRDVLRIRISSAAKGFRALDLCRTVPPCRMRDFAIKLHELGVINIRTESSLNGFQIGPMTIARDLDTVRKPFREIADKFNCYSAAAIADTPRGNKF